MILDGRKIAAQLREQLAVEIQSLPTAPKLGFIRSGDDLVAKKFVEMKSSMARMLGVEVVEFLLSKDADTHMVLEAVSEVAVKVDGMLVQMPLGSHIDIDQVLAAVPIEKDVDAMGERSGQRVLTPVIGACAEIMRQEDISLKGKKAVVVGLGKLVGFPAVPWLTSCGAEVEVITRAETDPGRITAQADIIILGAGSPGMLRPNMIKEGVIILDAGTSESKGTLKGDADPTCAAIASIFTPVPGGIGPIAIAMIFKNLLTLVQLQKLK